MAKAKKKKSKALVVVGPSKIHGVGCYADMKIRKGEFVRIFDPNDSRFVPLAKAHASPHVMMFRKFGIRTAKGYWAPADFLRISSGWYMNHSETPNIQSDDGDVTYYALKDIPVGEELTMDYRRMDDEFDNLDRDESIGGKPKKARRK